MGSAALGLLWLVPIRQGAFPFHVRAHTALSACAGGGQRRVWPGPVPLAGASVMRVGMVQGLQTADRQSGRDTALSYPISRKLGILPVHSLSLENSVAHVFEQGP